RRQECLPSWMQVQSPHLSVPYIERSLYSGLSSFGGDALRFTCVWRFELNTDFPRFKRKKREGMPRANYYMMIVGNSL
ncbi:hypothetical protein CGK38_23165, partial [Vibrio parahaemolyticus]